MTTPLSALKDTAQDVDELMQWLDTHSVSLTQGLPVYLLRKRWRQLGRTEQRLGNALQRLINEGWVETTPELAPAHLRVTVKGYARLLEQAHGGGAPALAVLPAGPPDENPCSMPWLAIEPVQRDTASGSRHALSEIELRNQILALYRDLGLHAEQRLIGTTLSRYWQERGQRVSDLRLGLDVLLRDGYLRRRLSGMDTWWVLTEAGQAYVDAAPTPAALYRLAPPAARLYPGVDPAQLRHGVHRTLDALAAQRAAVAYAALRAAWQAQGGEDNNLIHGLDLLLKDGALELLDSEPPALRLS